MSDLTRRELGRIAGLVAARALPAIAVEQTPAPVSPQYVGPLTGVERGLEDRRFDPVLFARDLYAAAPRQLRFQARTRADAEAWQRTLHAKLTELVGGFPAERSPLRAEIVESRSFPAYRREKVVFDSRPGVSVLAYVLTPSGGRTPLPALICVPGHGRGVDDVVGIDDRGRDRTDKAGYQHDFAIQVAEAGVAAVAIEPMGFGCRRDPLNATRGLAQKGCEPIAGGALMLGQTLIGWRVWDIMRTIDYIATRSDLDASRVGCMGISGGGTATLFATALEPRLRVALVSGYLNTFRDSVGSLAHCVDNYVPGILNWAEMHDIAGLIAPRPLFVESGERDPIFPVKASIESVRAAREIYQVFGAEDRIEHEVFPDEHTFWGRRGIPFVVRHLRA
ncbi:MAG TPA: alpha/beta hydrolase family protein [Vicinamibacterales bacterium]|nr:alpha/beta hydrolase family protein [Vicinamibacterales bacterium]